MSTTRQLLEDLDYLERVGLTVEQLRQVHHWGGDPDRERRVTFSSARSYFQKHSELLDNNAQFAARLHFIAEAHRGGLQQLVYLALQRFPK